MKEETRPLPDNPSYQLSKSGRLFSTMGQLCPELGKRGTRTAVYKIWIGKDRRRTAISDMMRDVWGKDFSPTPEWIDTVLSEAREAKSNRAESVSARWKKMKAAKLAEIKCGVCEEYFQPRNGNERTCTKVECQKERVRRQNAAARARKRAAAALKAAAAAAANDTDDIYKNCTPSFPCPFVDRFDAKGHFELRMKTDIFDFPYFTHAQNDPFGGYDDYENHAVEKTEPQPARLAA